MEEAELLIELVVKVPGCKPILLVRDEFAQQLSIWRWSVA